MEFIVIWIVCGFVAAWIGNTRTGSGTAGFWLGLLLGPFGILIACFLGDEDDKARKLVADGQRKRCPMCAEVVQPQALICKHCGHEFSEGETG